MSYLISLGGVACTTKTTIIKALQEYMGIEVHFSDYKELFDKFKFDHRVGSLLYSSYYTKQAMECVRDYSRVHIFDRHPMEGLLYDTMRKNIHVNECASIYKKCQEMGFMDNWIVFVMRVKPGSEDRTVEMMKKRDNNIDLYNATYVIEQDQRFEIFAQKVGAKVFVVDFKNASIDEQQNLIIKEIIGTIYNWTISSAWILFKFRVPLLKDKVAVFDFMNTLVEPDEDKFKLYPFVIKRFKHLIENNYTVVVISQKINFNENFKTQVQKVCINLNVPLYFYINCDQRVNIHIVKHLLFTNPQLKLNESFFVGDNDHGTNSNDSLFAKASNIKFISTEEYFIL
jgi:thymidylate kinase